MDINYKKKEKPYLHLNGQEMEEELLSVIQKVCKYLAMRQGSLPTKAS
jgi:hypothetical protein